MPRTPGGKKPSTKDRHKARKQVALQPRVHELVEALSRKTARPIRNEVHLAVIEHLRKNGVEVPQEVAESI